MVQLRLQGLKLGFSIVIIALKLSRFHQFIQLLLADLIIGESRLDDTLLEVLIVGISQTEV